MEYLKKHRNRSLSNCCAVFLIFFAACSQSDEPTKAAALPGLECKFDAIGTSEPNSSGTPIVINSITGTVISANFFDSGAIDPPYFDGLETVSVCIRPPDDNGTITARISTDVGLDNDTRIKAYPQFVMGTKFGNQFETSFRFYSNTGLPPEHQWPVVSDSLADNNKPFNLANLEYISKVRGIGLPAFTNNLPEITIRLDIDELNVISAERDVMLESWFYDTAANAQLIGNNIATGQPIANTLNNIVGIGHPHYSQLDNTLLEMMVHIGPLSPNDISMATRNPGQNQLTEIYSGKDHDGDGIDDHFDVDSHINLNTSQEPQPGRYSSGIDSNGDGIDDADILPVIIGDFQYSIWYGESFLSPIIIFSRETGSVDGVDFDPDTSETDLGSEGLITLDWNDFIDYVRLELEDKLAAIGVPWVLGAENPFPAMFSDAGAIGGLEFGVEPQINEPSDLPYTMEIHTFDVVVDDIALGLTDRILPQGEIVSPADNESLEPGIKDVLISATDEASGLVTVLVRVEQRDADPVRYWDGASWSESPVWIRADNIEQDTWVIQNVDFREEGQYRARIRLLDAAGNHSTSGKNPVNNFAIVIPDEVIPSGLITFPKNDAFLEPGIISINGEASDNLSGVERVLVRAERRDIRPVQYWNGNDWTTVSTWLPATLAANGSWSVASVSVENAGAYSVRLRVFDKAGNQATSQSNPVHNFTVVVDTITPTVETTFPLANSSLTPGFRSVMGAAADENSGVSHVLARIEKRHTFPVEYWNGETFVTESSWVRATLDDQLNWEVTAVDLNEPGTYRIRLRVFDNAGNQSRSSMNPVNNFSVLAE